MEQIVGTWTNPGKRRCWSKASYPNMAKASQVAKRMSTRDGDLLIAYECPDCRRFHVGHPDRAQTIAHEQAVAKAEQATSSRSYIDRLAPALNQMPTVCVHCGSTIPEERRRATALGGNRNVYCSQRCQRNYGTTMRKARKRLRKASNSAEKPSGSHPDGSWVS